MGEEVIDGHAADRGGGSAGEVGCLRDDLVCVGAGPGGDGGEGAEVFSVAKWRGLVVQQKSGRAEGGPRDAQRGGRGGFYGAGETRADEAGAGQGGQAVALGEWDVAAVPPLLGGGIG